MGHCFCADRFQSKKYNLPAIILCVGAGVKGELSLQMSALEQPQELHFSQNKALVYFEVFIWERSSRNFHLFETSL